MITITLKVSEEKAKWWLYLLRKKYGGKAGLQRYIEYLVKREIAYLAKVEVEETEGHSND